MNWDNLKYILTVSRTGSIAAAAKQLHVDRTTVQRKIKAFQEQIDFQIFVRQGSNYILAPGAEKILETAIQMESNINSLEHALEGRELRPQGLLRVTTTDSIFQFVLAPKLAGFRKIHPEITLELDVTNFKLSLTKRDADIAIRTGKSVPEHLVGYDLGRIKFGIYASKSYWKKHHELPEESHLWLGVEEPLLSAPPGQWIAKNVKDNQVILRTNSFVALMSSVETGLGISMLPCDLANMSRNLIKLKTDLSMLTNGLWLVTHPELVQSGRVQAFVEYLCDSVKIG